MSVELLIATFLYIGSLAVILAYFRFEHKKLKEKNKELHRARWSMALSYLIEAQMYLEGQADEAANHVINYDNPSYFQGMEQAFRESKHFFSPKIRDIQVELQRLNKEK